MFSEQLQVLQNDNFSKCTPLYSLECGQDLSFRELLQNGQKTRKPHMIGLPTVVPYEVGSYS